MMYEEEARAQTCEAIITKWHSETWGVNTQFLLLTSVMVDSQVYMYINAYQIIL
jgi:hypothetical protein